ncbi:MAG TPA: lamin tail domain-containing protein [Candidatus Paceibacterota bacterium]|jgi:hypothetical protein
MKSNTYFFVLAPFIAFIPFTVHAQVSITEIMYDLEGTDTGREWIEVRNNGTSSVDLNTWTFFEGDTNHKLSAVLGTGVVSGGAYAVIADNADAFRADWPGFSGTLLDSAFSLNNTGELLTLRNDVGVDVDSVLYRADWGATGDGNTLNLQGETWIPASPTPGTSASQSTVSPTVDIGGSNSSVESNKSTSASAMATLPEARYMARLEADKDRTVAVGASEFFEARAYDQNGGGLSAVTYTWNFGNGVVYEGKEVLHAYSHPGSYVVVVTADAPRGYHEANRFTVTAEPTLLRISGVVPQYIALNNDSHREIDLSMWSLRSGEEVFQVPHGTVILPGSTLRFSSTVTGLTSSAIGDVALLYPNGQTAYHYTQSRQMVPVSSSVRMINERASATPADAIAERSVDEPSSELAAAGATKHFEEGGNLYRWLLALVVLLVIAIGGLLFVRAKEETYSEASEYNIIDESDKT